MLISRANEQGSGKVIASILILVLAVAVYAAVQILPLYWDHANFEERVKETMVLDLVPPFKDVEATVRQKIVGLLDAMGAQYEKDHIKIEISEDNRKIHVEVWYSRKHGVLFYQNPKQFYTKLDHTSILPKLDLPKPTPLPDID